MQLKPKTNCYAFLVAVIALTVKLSIQTHLKGTLPCLFQKLFLPWDTLQLIYEDSISPSIKYTNPCIVTISDKPIKSGLNLYSNYVIFAANQSSFNQTLSKLKESSLWHKSNSPRGKFIVVTTRYMDINVLADTIYNYGIVDYTLLQKLDNSSHVYTTSYGKSLMLNFLVQDNTYEIRHTSTSKIKERAIKMILPFNVNISTTKIVDLKAIFELAFNNLNIIGKYLKMNVSYVLSNQTKTLIYNDRNNMYVYLSTTRDEELYENYDACNYFFQDFMVWIVPLPDNISTIETIVSTLDIKVWLAIITILIIESILWWLFSKSSKKQLVNLETSALGTFSIALGGSTYLPPKTNTLRVLLLFYLFYSMELSTIFQGKLFSGLTNRRKKHGITTMKELVDSPLPMIGSMKTRKFTLEYFSNHSIFSKILNKLIIQNPLDTNGSLINIARFKNCSTIMGKSALLYVFPQFKSLVRIIDQNTGLVEFEMTMAIKKGHYLLNVINKLIRRIMESGIYLKLFADATAPYSNQDIGSRSGASSIGLSHINGLFILWAIGITIGIIMFILEMWFYYCVKQRNFMKWANL